METQKQTGRYQQKDLMSDGHMKTNCKKCGVEILFFPSQKRQYCSWGCAFISKERNDKLKIKTVYVDWICKGCGKLEKLSKTQASRKIYCNTGCWTKTFKESSSLKCPVCGKEVIYKEYRTKKYCSNKCKLSALTQRTHSQEEIIRATQTRHNKGVYAAGNMYSHCKDGRREDLNGIYFRSRWEANYARYLNFLKEQGNIKSWEYEAHTFWFDGIKQGVVSYKPDFKIINSDGSHEWHEIKGYLDAKSKTKIKRMTKYHPQEKIILIGSKEYKAISHFARLIANWEVDSKGR